MLSGLDGKRLKEQTEMLVHDDTLFHIVTSARELRATFSDSDEADSMFGPILLATLKKLLLGEKFNGVMYSLSELKRLIDDYSPVWTSTNAHVQSDGNNAWIKKESLSKWMITNDIVAVLMKNYLHMSHYTAKIEDIIKFLRDCNVLTMEHLSVMWQSQLGDAVHERIVTNVHDLLAKVRFFLQLPR